MFYMGLLYGENVVLLVFTRLWELERPLEALHRVGGDVDIGSANQRRSLFFSWADKINWRWKVPSSP